MGYINIYIYVYIFKNIYFFVQVQWDSGIESLDRCFYLAEAPILTELLGFHCEIDVSR